MIELSVLTVVSFGASLLCFFFGFRVYFISRRLRREGSSGQIGPWGTATQTPETRARRDALHKARRRNLYLAGLTTAIVVALWLFATVWVAGKSVPIVVEAGQQTRAQPSGVQPPFDRKTEAALATFRWWMALISSSIAAVVFAVKGIVECLLAQRHRVPQKRAVFPDTFQFSSYGPDGQLSLKRATRDLALATIGLFCAIVICMVCNSCFERRAHADLVRDTEKVRNQT